MVRLQEKGGRQHAMPARHALSEAMHDYVAAAGIGENRKGWRSDGLSERPLRQEDAWAMIRRRAAAGRDRDAGRGAIPSGRPGSPPT